LRVIEQVEKFCSEIQSHVLPGQRELLDGEKVRVDKIGPGNRGSRGVPELTGCGKELAASQYRVGLICFESGRVLVFQGGGSARAGRRETFKSGS
jgi:hypothetical protein